MVKEISYCQSLSFNLPSLAVPKVRRKRKTTQEAWNDSHKSYSSDKAPGPKTSKAGSSRKPKGSLSPPGPRAISRLLLAGKGPKTDESDGKLFVPRDRTRLRPSSPGLEEIVPPLDVWLDFGKNGETEPEREGRAEMSGPDEPWSSEKCILEREAEAVGWPLDGPATAFDSVICP